MSIITAAGAIGGTQTIANADRARAMRQLLSMLSHAQNCMKRESISVAAGTCSLPACTAIKQVLIHMASCRSENTCPGE